MSTTMQKIREMVDANTIIGQPITTPDGVMLIPISKISFGFGSGGSDFATKNQPANKDNAFGGGGGAGVNITPVAFLIVNGDSVKALPIAPPANTTVDRVIELMPEIMDKIPFLNKKKKAEPAAAVEGVDITDKIAE